MIRKKLGVVRLPVVGLGANRAVGVGGSRRGQLRCEYVVLVLEVQMIRNLCSLDAVRGASHALSHERRRRSTRPSLTQGTCCRSAGYSAPVL